MRNTGDILARDNWRHMQKHLEMVWILCYPFAYKNTHGFTPRTQPLIKEEEMRPIAIVLTGLLIAVATMASVEADQEKGRDDTPDVYYSIHLASFKDLQRANRYVNSLKKEGKVVFWETAEVPDKGLFYRVYMGRFDNREDAVVFWKTLDKEGAVSYFGVHRFTEKKPEKPSDELPIRVAKAPPPDKLQDIKDRFVDNRDGTVTDSSTHLMWIRNGWRLDLFAASTWPEAVKKCEAFDHAGYTDWRLPTIEEWQSIIDTNQLPPALVEPNPFRNMIVHLPYWSKNEFVYDRRYPLTSVSPIHAYTVHLYHGRISHLKKSERAFILPVRSQD